MLHRIELTDAISRFEAVQFTGRVYRVTRQNVEPGAPSNSGGRWAYPAGSDGGCPILYMSLERDGAIAEVASYLSLLSPTPSKPLDLHTLEVSASKTIKIAIADIEKLGAATADYHQRNYERTREIGAAVNFLGYDGLIVPSARWKCDNLVIFSDNHGLAEKLEKVAVEQIDWQAWARDNGMLG